MSMEFGSWDSRSALEHSEPIKKACGICRDRPRDQKFVMWSRAFLLLIKNPLCSNDRGSAIEQTIKTAAAKIPINKMDLYCLLWPRVRLRVTT